jgi:hypothetical protein
VLQKKDQFDHVIIYLLLWRIFINFLTKNHFLCKNTYKMGAALKMPFNEAQIEILKLFTGNLTESQLQELRQVLIAFKFKLLDAHIESVSAEKGLSDAEFKKYR